MMNTETVHSLPSSLEILYITFEVYSLGKERPGNTGKSRNHCLKGFSFGLVSLWFFQNEPNLENNQQESCMWTTQP